MLLFDVHHMLLFDVHHILLFDVHHILLFDVHHILIDAMIRATQSAIICRYDHSHINAHGQPAEEHRHSDQSRRGHPQQQLQH